MSSPPVLNFVSLFQPIISTSFSLTRVVSHFSSLVQVGKRSTPLDLSRALRREESEETERGAAERSSHRPRHRLGGKKKASAPRLLPLGAASLSVLFARSLDHPFAFARGGGKGPPIPISTLVLTSYYRPNPISTGIQNRKRTA